MIKIKRNGALMFGFPDTLANPQWYELGLSQTNKHHYLLHNKIEISNHTQ